MARQGISTGTSPNDGLGDSLLAGAVKINQNFLEIYSTFGNGNVLSSYANNAGVATYSATSGVSTSSGYATIAGVATYASTAGVSTTVSGGFGSLLGLTVTGLSTLSVNSSIDALRVTQSGNGNALVVETGGPSDPTPLIVTGIGSVGVGTDKPSSLFHVQGDSLITGVVTANAYYGDGSNLTGLSASQWVTTPTGIHTLSSVGIGTTNALTRLDLNGGTLSFGKKASNIGDISIGNTSTSLGYAGLGEFLNPYYQNNVFVGNDIFQNRANTNLPGYNVIIGDRAGNTLGDGCNENVIIGRDAGFVNRGSGNNFIGNRTGQSNTTGYFNVFLGYDAGNFNTTGFYNTFIGNEAGYRNTIGNNNFYGGQFSGYFNQGGKFNLALGDSSANGFDGSNTTYDSNIHLGSVNGSVIGGSYQILIGSGNNTGSRYFNLPDPNKNYQFAVGIRTDVNPSKYWLVGNENFNVGIGTTLPTSKIHVVGDALITGITTVGLGTTSAPSNSQLSFELISNTQLRIKVRGTDGVLRSADITLA